MTFAIPVSFNSPCRHFSSKFEWSPLWILPKFSVIPSFRFSVTIDPPFCSLKIKWSPLKSSPPGHENDRSLRLDFRPFSVLPEQRLIEPTFLLLRFQRECPKVLHWGLTISEMTYEHSKEISVPIVDYCQRGKSTYCPAQTECINKYRLFHTLGDNWINKRL